MINSIGSKDVDRRRLSSLRSLGSVLIVGQLLWLFCSSAAQAQTAVTRYIPLGNSFMPFTVYIAPVTLSVVTASGVMKYNTTATTANVNWTSVTDADLYKLDVWDVNTQQWTILYDGPATVFVAEGLSLGLKRFRVTACGGGLCGGTSAYVELIIEENLDLDLDGVPDQNDACLGTLEGEATSASGCVPTTADIDGDGVTDDLDFCNGSDATSTSANSNGCTPDQIDSDSDGTPDYQDSYPYQSDTQCTP